MTERQFKLVDSSLISCDTPCNREFAREVTGDKIKQAGGISTTLRCVAAGAALRGQHYGPAQEAHSNLPACRVCLVYTQVDNNTPQA